MTEKILPRPVLRDGNGKLTKNYSERDWYLKLQEEIFEAFDSYSAEMNWINDADEEIELGASFRKTAEEIADVITVCTSWLEALGYDEKKRSELFATVNAKNEKRGYFEEG